jgi:hypothetical protein
MAYFLQAILPADWAISLAVIEMLMWVAMFSLIFLGKHENKDQINLLGAALTDCRAEIASLKAQLSPVVNEVKAPEEPASVPEELLDGSEKSPLVPAQDENKVAG